MPFKFLPGTSKPIDTSGLLTLLYPKLDSKDKGARKHLKDWHLPNPFLS
jgi:hypothetical protein